MNELNFSLLELPMGNGSFCSSKAQREAKMAANLRKLVASPRPRSRPAVV